jgi:hypothetical protein
MIRFPYLRTEGEARIPAPRDSAQGSCALAHIAYGCHDFR